MIVTCPSCEAQYKLQIDTLPDTGRRVRCSDCGEVWTQYNADHEPAIADEMIIEWRDGENTDGRDDGVQDNAMSFEDIPDGVKPRNDVHGKDEKDKKDKSPAQNPPQPESVKENIFSLLLARHTKYFAWGAAFLLMAGVLILLGLLRPVMERIAPATANIYNRFGFNAMHKDAGAGLVFEHVKAEMVGHNQYTITGKLINLTSDSSTVPFIEVVFLDAHELPLAAHVFEPAQNVLAGQGIVEMHYNVHEKAVGVHKVRVALSLNKTPVVALPDDGDGHAAQDEHDTPHDNTPEADHH